MKVKKIICGAVTLLTAACCVGCGRNGCGTKPTDESVRITVWVSEADRGFAQEVAENFKAQRPEKRYEFVIDVQGENDVATRVLNDVENAADVFSCLNDQLPKLINGDALAKLGGERLANIKKEQTLESMDAVTLGAGDAASVWGIPYTDNTFFLYYDKSVFSETDVESLDGILSKCTSTKQFAFPMTDGWYTTSFYFGKGLGYDVEYDENFAEKKITCDFDGDIGTAVTETVWDLVQDSRVKADANDSKITAGFADGTLVAAVSGIWNKAAIATALGDRFAAAKLPTYAYQSGEQVQLVSFAGYKLMGVNQYSKHKTDAFDFAEFYTNRENQLKHFDDRGYLPTNVQALADERIQSDDCARAIYEQLKYSKPQKNVPSTLWVPMEGLGTAMIAGAQNGSFDLNAQLKACVDAIEKNA